MGKQEWMPLDNSSTLARNDPLIGGDIFEGFRSALGPADGDVHFGEVAQAKVDAKVALGDEIATAAHFIDLLVVSRGCGDPRANGVAARCS